MAAACWCPVRPGGENAETPERAQMDCILATPPLIRLQPMLESRIIGDLSKTTDVQDFLDTDPKR